MDLSSGKGGSLEGQGCAEQGNQLPWQSHTPGSSSFLVPPQVPSWRQQQSTITCGSPCWGHSGASADTVPVFTGCIVSSEAQQTATHPPLVLVNCSWHMAMCLYFCVVCGCCRWQVAELVTEATWPTEPGVMTLRGCLPIQPLSEQMSGTIRPTGAPGLLGESVRVRGGRGHGAPSTVLVMESESGKPQLLIMRTRRKAGVQDAEGALGWQLWVTSGKASWKKGCRRC